MKKLLIAATFILICIIFRPIDIHQPSAFGKKILAEDGQLLSAQIASDEQWRFAPDKLLPARYVQSIINYEDKRFYYHLGIDPLSVARAIKDNVSARRVVSGASTLTMQLARMLGERSERTVYNKFVESINAIRIEFWHSKSDILRYYTAYAPFGGNVVGVDAAAWKYFQKTPHQLTWAECATLAVLPNAPGLIHPNRNRDILRTKRDKLLLKLQKNSLIDELEYSLAVQENLPLGRFDLPRLAPHYLHLSENGDNSAIHYQWQIEAGKLLDRHYYRWGQNDIHNAAILVIENKTRDIKVYQGNIPSTKQEEDVDMIQSRRSSGSILKPMLYAAALDKSTITPFSLLDDVPMYINGFHPTNFDRKYQGSVAADKALSKSLNVPFVQLLQEVGTDPLIRILRKLGLSSIDKDADHYGLSLILGGGEVRLNELANAYAYLSNVLDGTSNNSPLSAAAIYHTFEAMREVIRPTNHGLWQKFDSGIPIAWKTGTSFGHRDAWAVGVHPDYTIASWVGNADGQGREGLLGGQMAGDLLFGMIEILDLTPKWWKMPAQEMSQANICLQSGFLASASCQDIRSELVLNASLRTQPCPFHKTVFVTPDGYQIGESCAYDGAKERQYFFQLAPRNAHYYQQYHPEFRPMPDLHPSCRPSQTDVAMQFIYPNGRQAILAPRDLNAEQQEFVYRAAHHDPNATLYWYFDNDYLGSTTGIHKISHLSTPGVHLLTIIDHNGNRLSHPLTVKTNPLDAVLAVEEPLDVHM